jgi:hypothetical protein
LGREHLPDVADATLAVRARLTTLLDLPQRACAATDLFVDAAVGDTLADADEHVRGGPGLRLIWMLKFVFNSVLRYSGVVCGAQALILKVEIANVSPIWLSFSGSTPNA